MGFTNPHPASRLTLDSTASINSGLQGFWPLTDGGSSTTAKDITSNANDGTQSGGVSWASTDIGTVASFDGIDDKFDLTSIGGMDFSSSDFTVSMWLWVDSISDPEYLWTKQTSSNSPGCTFWFWNPGTLQLIHLASTSNCTTDYAIAASLVNGWNHIVASVASPASLLASNHAVYVNGEFVTPGSAVNGSGTIVASPGELYIAGRGSDNARQLSGDYQNVRVYNRVLSATEVATLYHRPWEGTNYGTLWPYSPPAPADATLSTDTAATSLMSGCQAWWLLTNGSGTTATDIVGSNNGTITNGTWSSQSVGNALELDTSANASGTGVNVSSGVAISLWYKDVGGTASGPMLFSLPRSTGGANGVDIQHRGTGARFNLYTATGGLKAATASFSINDGDWHHIAGTYDGANIRLYADGAQLATNTQTGTIGHLASGEFNINALASGISGFSCDGVYQNVRVWDRNLSADEITLLYERPFEGIEYGDAFHYDPPTPANLTPLTSDSINTDQELWLPLTDGSGTSPADISGNSETFTNGGTSTWDVQRVGSVAVTNNNTGEHYSSDSSFSTIIGGSTPATDPWTISCWISTYLLGSSYLERGILSIGSSSADGTPFLDVQHHGTTFRFFWAGPGGWTDVEGLSHREWSNVTISFDGSVCSVYVNGVIGGSRTATGTNGSTSDKLWIGTGYNNISSNVDTYFQNVRVWSRSLSADEVWSIYENPWLGSAYTATAAEVLYNYIFRSQRFRRLA